MSSYRDTYPWHRRASDSPEVPKLETEDNPVIGRLLGPRGQVVKVVRARATVPFGYQRS